MPCGILSFSKSLIIDILSFIKRHIWRKMTLRPVLEEKLNTALAPASAAPMTRRDATLPDVPNKAQAVTGMRRTGKTAFLRQLVAERQRDGSPERAIYLSL
jgi:hypothetical protein